MWEILFVIPVSLFQTLMGTLRNAGLSCSTCSSTRLFPFTGCQMDLTSLHIRRKETERRDACNGICLLKLSRFLSDKIPGVKVASPFGFSFSSVHHPFFLPLSYLLFSFLFPFLFISFSFPFLSSNSNLTLEKGKERWKSMLNDSRFFFLFFGKSHLLTYSSIVNSKPHTSSQR